MTSTARTRPTPNRFRRRWLALTLIEVVAALLILGGSATAVLVAQADSVAHLETSRLQLTAQHAARELIATWKIEKEDLTLPATGVVPGASGWTWQRSSQQLSIAERASVRRTLRPSRSKSTTPNSRSSCWICRETAGCVRASSSAACV